MDTHPSEEALNSPPDYGMGQDNGEGKNNELEEIALVAFKNLINRDIMGKMKGNTFKLVMTLTKIWHDQGCPASIFLTRKTIKHEAGLSGNSAFTRAMKEAESLGLVERVKSNNPAKASR